MGMFVKQPYIFGVKAKENEDKVPTCTGYLNSIKIPLKQDLLLILVPV